MSSFSALQDFVHSEKFPEWITGISTLLLFVSTILLVVVTRQLAVITREDGRYRRFESTTDAWMKIRASLDLPDLRHLTSAEEIISIGQEHRDLLRSMEGYALCVNAGVYDLRIFNRISGFWFVENVDKIWPYIKLRHDSMDHHPYGEIMIMYKDIIELRQRRGHLAK